MVVQHSLEAGQSAVRRSGGGVQRASPARFSGKPLLQACAVRPVSTPSTSRNKIFMVCFENHQKNVTPTPSTGRGCRCKRTHPTAWLHAEANPTPTRRRRATA